MQLMKKLIQNVRVKPQHAEDLKEVAFRLSMKKGDFIRESELVHFLIENYLHEIEYENGELRKKV